MSEKAAVDAASRSHFLEEQLANIDNFDYKVDETFDRGATEESEQTALKPKSQRKRSKAGKRSKYGYKYDGFIDDSDEMDSDNDWEETSEPKAKKKTKGRAKKIKEEDEDKTQQSEPNMNIPDPLLKAREDAMERTFHELNEFYNVQADLTQNAQVTFHQVSLRESNCLLFSLEIFHCQDDDGVFHCEVQNCIFSTLVSYLRHLIVMFFVLSSAIRRAVPYNICNSKVVIIFTHFFSAAPLSSSTWYKPTLAMGIQSSGTLAPGVGRAGAMR